MSTAPAPHSEVDTGWQIDEDTTPPGWTPSARRWPSAGHRRGRHCPENPPPAKGLAQYEKTGETGRERIVSETGRRFIVNLEAYLDTGLFLDHRNTRRVVGEHAAGKRF